MILHQRVDPSHTRPETDTDEEAALELARSGPFTSNQVAELLGIEVHEARVLLKRLVAQRRLDRSGQTRGTRYFLPGSEVGAPQPGRPRSAERGPRISRPAIDAEVRAALLAIAGEGRLTNAVVRERLGVDAQSANEILMSLVREGDLVRQGRARGTFYVLPEI